MATVYSTLDPNEPFTDEEIAMLDALEDRPIVYDDDCPYTSYDDMIKAIEYTKKHKLLEKRDVRQSKIASFLL